MTGFSEHGARRDRRAWWLFFAMFLLLAAGSRGTISNIDTQIRYMVAWRIYDDASVHPHPDELLATGGEFATGRHGDPVSPYGLGQSITMLPAVAMADVGSKLAPAESRAEIRYLAGQFIYKTLFLPLWGALAAVSLFTLARRFGLDPRAAIMTALAATLGTFWWYYAKTIGHGLEVTTLLLAALALWREPLSTRRTVAIGGLFGLSLLYRMDFLIPVAAITAWAAFRWGIRERRFSTLAAFVLPIFFCGLAVLWHNYERSGSILEAGYSGALENAERAMFAQFPGQHLLTILFGWTRGFLWFSPIFFAAVLLPFCRRERSIAVGPRVLLGAGAIVASYALFVASLDLAPRVGGWGQRYLLPITPFLVLGLAIGLRPLIERPRFRAALASFVFMNIALQGALTFFDHIEGQRQTGAVIAAAEASDRPDAAPTGWRATEWAAALRNWGVPLGDSAAVLEAWAKPEITALRTSITDNLWWLKLAAKTRGAKALLIRVVGGGLLLIAGLAFAVLWRGSIRRGNRTEPESLHTPMGAQHG